MESRTRQMTSGTGSNRQLVLIVGAVLALMIAIGLWTGRVPFGPQIGLGGLTGAISSPDQSHVIDPHAVLHVVYGLLVYAFVWMVLLGAPAHYRFMLAVGLGVGSVIIENSALITQRYQEVTVSVGYFGNSIVTSLSDMAMIALGSLIAWRWPVWVSVVFGVALEVILALWLRNNLTLTVITFIYPFAAIKVWQAGAAQPH
jgi:Protein of unknown function (DUF2585)